MDDYPSLESLLAHQPLIQSGPFVAGIVHDVNNGVGAVIAYAELIGMGSPTARDLDEMLDDLLSAAKRVANLNEALSILTRPDSPKSQFVSVGKLVEQLVLVCEYRYQTRSVRLDVSLEGDLERSVKCYRNQLARATVYLLLNALENSEDAARKEVALTATVDSEGVAIRVRDRGPELQPEQFERAVQPFFTTKPPPHLGLGLTAAKAVAELHDGTLSYAPEMGFTLGFPHPAD